MRKKILLPSALHKFFMRSIYYYNNIVAVVIIRAVKKVEKPFAPRARLDFGCWKSQKNGR